jgi:hypothetical protein
VISTKSKSKIPKTHSWPIGAKAISDALKDTQQYELLEIRFRFWAGFMNDRGKGFPYPVLCVAYSGPKNFFSGSNWMAEKGYYDPKWEIVVYPVPRLWKHVIKGMLIAEALPKIRGWLISNVHSMGREGSHALTFQFDELKNEITSEETASSEWNTERC